MITNLDKKIIFLNAKLENQLADLTKKVGFDINLASEKTLKSLDEIEKKFDDKI